MRSDSTLRLSALCLGALALFAEVAHGSPRPVPDIWPKLYTTMIGRIEASDFAGMRKYDVLEVGNWAFTTSNGFRDSMQTLRDENPDLMVMQDWSGAISCDNWWSDETPDREAWGDTLEAHADDWILHDKNGTRWFINGESEICNNGRINMTNFDAARAYAKYIAKVTVHEYPDLIEGIRLDEVGESIHWWHSVPHRWDPGVDSIDSNRDGIGDKNEDLEAWWSAGIDTFLTTLRAEFGPEYLIVVNGYLAPHQYQHVNGRWHEGHPHEHKKGYESGMTDPERGYLGGDTLYSDVPAHFSGLFCLNFTPTYQFDPDKLSTKHTPYPHPLLPKFVGWTLGSSLMGDGWYSMSGWGTAVDYKGDPKPMQYQTLWWFGVYDLVRDNIGTPLGRAVRDTTADGKDRWMRDFTGGRVRVYVNQEKSIFDLKPHVQAFDPAPGARVGDPITLSWEVDDPNYGSQSQSIDVYLSRDGGATYPELLGSFDESVNSYDWTVTGTPGTECHFKVVATDTSGMTGEAASSASFTLMAPGLIEGGMAEVVPTSWLVNAEEVLCTLDAAITLNDSGATSWDEARIVLPAEAPYRNYYATTQNGSPIGESVTLNGDTIVVALDSPVSSAAPVSFTFGVSSPGTVSTDSLAFAFGVRSTVHEPEVSWMGEGNANGDAADANALRAWAGLGPAVSLVVTPGAATVASGVAVSFGAQGFDAVGNSVPVNPAWTIDAAVGTIDSTGFFQSGEPGTAHVIATDGALADSAFVTVTPGSPHTITIDSDSLVLAAGETHDLGATVTDSLGNPLSYEPDWTSANDSLVSVDSNGVVTAIHPGVTIVTATVDDVSSDVAVTVVPGPADSVAVSPASAVVARGDTVRFRATVYDAFGHVRDDTVSWSTTDSIGEVLPDGLFLAVFEGSGFVAADAGGAQGSAAVQVIVELVDAFIAPAPAQLSADSSAAFTLHTITSDGDTLALDAAWSLLAGGGSLQPTGVFAPGAAGEVTIEATSGAWADSVTFAVVPGAPVALAIDGPETAVAGDTLTYSSALTDAHGNAVSAEVTWDDAEGLVNLGNGVYVAHGSGERTIGAAHEGLATDAPLTVAAGAVASLDVSPDSLTLDIDSSAVFTVELLDAFGNVATSTVTWTIPSGIGSIAPDRTFTAGAPGAGALIAHAGGVADTAHIFVREPEKEEDPRPTRVEVSLDRSVLTPLDDAYAFEAALVAFDSADAPMETEEPESIFVDIREAGDHPAKGVVYWSAVHVVTLPATLSFELPDLDGCGAVELSITTLRGLAADSEPLAYRTSNLDGDDAVGLDDLATLLALDTSDECRDLDGDGGAGHGDVDLALDLIESYGWDGTPAPATDDDPFWVLAGDTTATCGDSLAPVIELHPGSLDSVYAVVITNTNEAGASKQGALTDETISRSVTDDDGSVHWIYVSDGDPISLHDGGPLLALSACGFDREAWENGGSFVRFLETGFTWTDPVEVQLKATDTGGGTDTTDTGGGTDTTDTGGGTDTTDTGGGTDTTDTGGGTDTTANETTIVAYAMFPSQPNPAPGRTLLRYALPGGAADVEIVVHDMSGREIRRFRGLPDWQGSHAVEWNGVDSAGRYAPSGVYFLTLSSSHGRRTSRVTIVR